MQKPRKVQSERRSLGFSPKDFRHCRLVLHRLLVPVEVARVMEAHVARDAFVRLLRVDHICYFPKMRRSSVMLIKFVL